MSYDLQEQGNTWPTITSPRDGVIEGPGLYWLNVQDDADYILNRTVVFYPCDDSGLNDAEKSVVF